MHHVQFWLQAQLKMFDALDRWVNNVGTKLNPWVVKATIVTGTGHADASIYGNYTCVFNNGTCEFNGLSITHAGKSYRSEQ